MYAVVMESVGNPDLGQYAPLSPGNIEYVDTLEAASAACRAYIDKYDLGGGNWPNARVYKRAEFKRLVNPKPVATISYNGRVWPS